MATEYSVRCKKCNDKGLVPSKVLGKFSGKLIPHCFQPCECQERYDYYPRIKPTDFDFPISYDFYRALCQQHEWPNPGSDYPIEELEQVTPPEAEWTRRQWDSVKQLKAMVLHLQEKVNQKYDKKKEEQGRYE